MVDAMKEIAKMEVGLTQEERNLLSVAYKNVIGARRASWRIISSLEKPKKEDDDKEDGKDNKTATEYRKKIEKELQDTCNDILDLLDKHLITSVGNDDSNTDAVEAYVFYYKM